MDRLAADLEQFLRRAGSASSADIHCRHVALRLVRRIKYGTKGELELKALLQDLMESLPFGSDAIFGRIRLQADLFLQINLPMRPSSQKRPSSALLEPPAKRSRRTLEDAQLLYNYFHPLTTSSVPSISTMLADSSASSSTTVVETGSMHDIWQAAKPLLAPHKALAAKVAELEASFSADDLSPSATIDFLANLVDLLGKLCAPVRDSAVKEASDRLCTCREMSSLHGTSNKVEEAIEVAKASVHTLVQEMQQDMRAFKAGYTVASKGEGELREEMRQEAMKREREAVTEVYGEDKAITVATWCGIPQDTLNRGHIATRLTQLLFGNQAVTVPDPTKLNEMQSSDLPPIFLLAAKHLFRIQNRLQAMTVLATLSTLVPSESTKANWAQRVWTLLDSEIDTPDGASEHTKVANIAEEILLAIDSRAELDRSRLEKIKSQVGNMVSLEDPVFKLLRGRLENTITAGVTGEGETSISKGFAFAPLPGQIAQTIASIKSILEWAFSCWDIRA